MAEMRASRLQPLMRQARGPVVHLNFARVHESWSRLTFIICLIKHETEYRSTQDECHATVFGQRDESDLMTMGHMAP